MMWHLKYALASKIIKRSDFRELMQSDELAELYCRVPDEKCVNCKAYDYMGEEPLSTVGGWKFIQEAQHRPN